MNINLVRCLRCEQHRTALHCHDTPLLYHIHRNSYCTHTRDFTIYNRREWIAKKTTEIKKEHKNNGKFRFRWTEMRLRISPSRTQVNFVCFFFWFRFDSIFARCLFDYTYTTDLIADYVSLSSKILLFCFVIWLKCISISRHLFSFFFAFHHAQRKCFSGHFLISLLMYLNTTKNKLHKLKMITKNEEDKNQTNAFQRRQLKFSIAFMFNHFDVQKKYSLKQFVNRHD